MNDVRHITFRIVKIDVAILLILIGLSIIFANNIEAQVKGYIFGGLIGILDFIILGKTISKAVVMPQRTAVIYIRVNYFVRLLIKGIVVVVSIKADYINVICVIIGLLLIKHIILVDNLLGKKRKASRKECE